ncbi:MAG: hypothetical protein ACYC0T_08265 [Ramlibacter sp.]
MTSLPATSRRRVLAAACAAAVLGACTSPPPAPPGAAAAPPAAGSSAPAAAGLPRYRCDHGIAFTVRHGDDSVTIDAGPRGRHMLLRDAGGLTPQHTVYSNDQLKAEFGLGAAGNEAILRSAEPPLVARCVRE